MNIFDKRPLSLILCIMLGGFVFFSVGSTFVRIALIAAAIVLCTVFLYFYIKKSSKPIIIFSAAALAIGILASHIYFSLLFNPYDRYEGGCEIEADVTDSDTGSYTTSYVLSVKTVNGDKIYGRKALVRLYDVDANKIRVGDTIKFIGTFENFENTEDFDSQSYYYARGIATEVTSISDIEILETDSMPLSYHSSGLREQLRRHSVMCSDALSGNMLSALLLGERSYLDPQIRLDFTRIGITHILALSGMHLSILAYALERLLSLLKIKKKARYVVTIVFVVLYMAFTGFSVSVVRAAFMLIIAYLLFLFSRTHDSITSLAISVTLICIITPYAIYDIALWLSAFATLGVIVAAELQSNRSEKEESFIHAVLRYSFDAILVSVFAITATYFISAFTFGGFSLLSVGGTIVFSLLTELIMHIGTLMLIFGSFIPFSHIVIFLSHLTANLASLLSEPRWVYVSSDYIPLKILTVISVIVFFAFIILKLKNKRRFVCIIVALFVLTGATGAVCQAATLSSDEISYYSYGKCDIILVKSSSECALINSSQYSKSTAYTSADVLADSKITYLDTYVLTHYSWNIDEHISSLLSTLKVKSIYIPTPVGSEEIGMAKSVLSAVSLYDTEVYFIDKTVPINCGNVVIHHDFSTSYEDSKNLCAVRIYKGEKSYTYLSSGMLECDSYPTYDNIAASDAVIFGAYGSKYSKDVYINDFFDLLDTVIIGGDGIYFEQDTYARYKENGCEFYSHPQNVKAYID